MSEFIQRDIPLFNRQHRPQTNNAMSNEVESMQIDQSEDLPQYEKAEVKSLPTKKFVCVEYPGNVKNVDKAVDTLGGIGSIQRVSTYRICFLEN